jgi:hypothetical protein
LLQFCSAGTLEEIEEYINKVEDHLPGRILRTRTTKNYKETKTYNKNK